MTMKICELSCCHLAKQCTIDVQLQAVHHLPLHPMVAQLALSLLKLRCRALQSPFKLPFAITLSPKEMMA